MHRSVYWYLIALLPLCFVPVSALSDLRLATWNIEHLSANNGKGCKPRTDTDYERLNDYVDGLDADIIAFQEVENRHAVERVFSTRDYSLVLSERPRPRHRSECWHTPGHHLTHQRVGFAVRNHIPYKRLDDVKELAIGGTRRGVEIVIYPNDNPIHLLAIHLKSGCFEGDLARQDRSCRILDKQLKILESWVDTLASQGQRFAILGDFNRRLNIPGDDFWLEIDDSEPTLEADIENAGANRLSMSDDRYCVKEAWKHLIDHIVVSRTVDLMLKEPSFQVHLYPPGSTPRPSDHCAVSVVLNPDRIQDVQNHSEY